MTTTHWQQLVKRGEHEEGREHFLAHRVHALRTPGEMAATKFLLISILFIFFANFVGQFKLFLSRSNFDHKTKDL